MQTRQLGNAIVSAIGLGGMQMSVEGRPRDRSRSIATIHAALDAGVTLIDTADAYHIGPDEVGHNETLIAEALSTYGGDTSDVVVATKGGHLRRGDGSWPVNGTLATSRRRARRRSSGSGSRPSTSTSSTGPTRRCRTTCRSVRCGPARRGEDSHGRHLQRRPGADPGRAGRARGTTRLGAEPVLAPLPVEPARARAVRRDGDRVSAVEPVRRWLAGQWPRLAALRVRRRGQGTRRLAAAGDARLDVGAVPGGHPDTRGLAPGDDP